MIIPVLTTGISLLLKKHLSDDSIEKHPKHIEQANNSFLPSYLGYFFVALSIPNLETLWFVYFMVFVFTFYSQTIYFNPMFLVYGYRFYNVTTDSGVEIFLISKRQIKAADGLVFGSLKRINNFTFIDIENTEENDHEPCDSQVTPK
jgi:hypothetical protein